VTLIEMMVVVAIVGIIAALAVPDLTPVIRKVQLDSAAQQAAGFLERARRLAMNEGRCYRVFESGGVLGIQRRSTANCGYCIEGSDCDNVDSSTKISATVGWDATLARLHPEAGIVFATPDVSTGSIGAGTGDASIVFRPNGRLRGDGDLDLQDEGARIVVSHNSLAQRLVLVHVEATGRICGIPISGGGTPAFSAPTLCGAFQGGGSSGGGGGGGACAQAGGDAPALALLALLGIVFVPRLQRRKKRRAGAPPKAPSKPEPLMRTTTRRRRPVRARGYLLIEVMASGALLALILGTTLTVVASSRVQISRSANRAVATDIGQYYMNLMRSCNDHADTTNCGTGAMGAGTCPAPAHPVIAAAKPGFSVQCEVAQSGLHTQSTPNLFSNTHLYVIRVEVTYVDMNNTSKTLQYERYRRDRPFSG
jgi:prepilin-type N-terminal cleavage/methylation domain-containing protein